MSTVRTLLVGLMAASPLMAQVKLPPRPESPPPSPFVYPAFTVDSLANGLRFAVIENHELPLVTVQTAIPGAGPLGLSFLDTPGKEGAWGLMLTALREGTTMRSFNQMVDEALDLGADMRFTATAAFTPPGLRATRSTWRPALDLLADAMINPTFPEAGLARAKNQLSIALDRLQPISIANRIVTARLYGVGGAYDRFATSATLANVTRDDVIAMQQKYLRPQNAIVVIAGDVTLREAREAMRSAFGGWQRGGTTIDAIVPDVAAPSPTTIYLKDNPGAAQSIVIGAQLVPGRDSPDAAAIDALGSVLGDFSVSSGSRFYSAFRTERGLSYSPAVDLAARPIPEKVMLSARAAVGAAVTDTAVTTLLNVFRELKQSKPVKESELDFSKRNLVGSLPGSMERLDLIAGNVLASIRDRLPPGYLNAWIGRVNALALPEVQAAATRHLDPDHMVIAVVGDRAKIEGPLRATGIPVVVVP